MKKDNGERDIRGQAPGAGRSARPGVPSAGAVGRRTEDAPQ